MLISKEINTNTTQIVKKDGIITMCIILWNLQENLLKDVKELQNIRTIYGNYISVY